MANHKEVEGEHIYPQTHITELAHRWKELNASGEHKKAMLILEEIVIDSTMMFERLAQHDGFHHTVDLPILVAAAQSKVEKWLLAWNPKKGNLFTWTSKSVSGCTRILCEDLEYRRIDDIVENKLPLKVLSLNESTNKFEPKPITDWIKSRADKKMWRKLSVTHPAGFNRTFFVTGDHEMFTDRGWIQIDNLRVDDRLFIRTARITKQGIQALIGMRLGDGTIGRRGKNGQKVVFGVSHGLKQRDYCAYIADKFSVNLCDWTATAEGKEYSANKISISLTTLWPEGGRVLPQLKGVNDWMLDHMDWQAIAYWYMDDGSLKGSTPILHTHAFSQDDAALLAACLKEKFSISSSWACRANCHYGDTVISEDSRDMFFSSIAPYVVPCLRYKLPDKYRNAPFVDSDFLEYAPVACGWSARPVIGFSNVRRCTSNIRRDGETYYKGGFYTPDFNWKYDITVADNFNFVAEDIVAHNCAKNAFRSEVLKAAQYNRRFHVTSENLEKFFGSEDHAADRVDVANVLRDKLKQITVRWGDPQEIGSIRFLMACVLSNDEMKNANACIRAASYAYGISFDLAKFFYQWVLMELREQMYQKVRVPFTEQDLFRHRHSYSSLVDLLQFITWDQMKKIIAVMGGTRIKVPTLAQMHRMNDEYELFEEIDASDKDPASVEAIAKKKNKSLKNAQQVYEDMCQELHPKRSGDYPLYDGDNEVQSLFDSQGSSFHKDVEI